MLTALRSAVATGPVVHPAATGTGPGRELAGGPVGTGRRAGRPAQSGGAPAREVVRALLEHVRPALDELGDQDMVSAGVEAILRRGTSADRQRAAGDPAAALDQLVEETRAGH